MKSLLCREKTASGNGNDSLPAAFLSKPAATSRGEKRDKKPESFLSGHKLLPMNSCSSEVEFYYWKRATLEFAAAKIVGKLQ